LESTDSYILHIGQVLRYPRAAEDPPENVGELVNFKWLAKFEGAGLGSKPKELEIVFEVEDPLHVAPLSIQEVIAQCLPDVSSKERVYLIGHPQGHELQFSLQDNWVLDHAGLPNGEPPRPERIRMHYFAPTAKGSSGSPVFDKAWNCVALHHAGAKHDPPPEDSGMRKLNGKDGYYSANEGISIESICDDVEKGGKALAGQ